jgi:hypothetical protein
MCVDEITVFHQYESSVIGQLLVRSAFFKPLGGKENGSTEGQYI